MNQLDFDDVPARRPRSAGGSDLLWPFLLRTLSNVISIVVGVLLLVVLLRFYLAFELDRIRSEPGRPAPASAPAK